MTTNPDALRSLERIEASGYPTTPFGSAAKGRDFATVREALAAPAEGGQGEAVVNLATLQRWHAALDGYHPSDVPDTVAAREEMAALIDSAGGAKGEVTIDLDRVFLDACNDAVKASTWMPAEYTANDWQADVLDLLRNGPGTFTPQPAEGGQGELRKMIDAPPMPVFYTDASHAWAAGWERSYEAHRALIDSAGGAKGATDEQGRPMTYWGGKVPQPAEGDGAAGEVCVLDHDDDAKYVRLDNEALPAGTKLYTHPAATTVVPENVAAGTARCLRWLARNADPDDAAEAEAHATRLETLAAAPAAPKGGVVDEAMARRYLAAQKDYIGKVDAAFGRQVAGALHSDDVIGACMAGLTAALATGEQSSIEQGGQEVGNG